MSDKPWSEVCRKAGYITFADAFAALEAQVAEAQLARDVLWCKALVATLDTRQIERVTRCFNENRPDPPSEKTKKMLSELRKAAGGVR